MKLPKQHKGMTLIEVLVSLLIFSFGILSLVALQARAVQFSVSAEDTNRASLFANEIAAAMWNAQTTNLPAATIEAWRLRIQDTVKGGLPNGDGEVTLNAGIATVTVTWRPFSGPKVPVDNRFVTQVLIPTP